MKFEIYLKYLLGLFLIMVGINKFIPFMPPISLSKDASVFMKSILETGYLMAVVGIVEGLCGLMLLRKSTTPLALVLLAPISVNIVFFHLFLDFSTIWMALFVTVSNVFLLYRNRDFYSPILLSITNGKKITREYLRDHNLSSN
jgi:putative oxidoreductase